MSGPSASVEAVVLAVHPPAEAFARIILFSAEQGALTAFQRISRKANSQNPPLDLFDRCQLLLEPSSQGDAWFVKEAQILARQTNLGRTYEHLVLSSAFAQCLARNPVALESRGRVWLLLLQALESFARHGRPDVTYFKSLYVFVKDEGYPLRQHWLPALSSGDQALAAGLLRQPVEDQTASPAEVQRLLRRLDDYLRAETELFLPALPTAPR